MVRGSRILIIDDDPAIRTLLRRALTEAGHRTQGSPMNEDALRGIIERDVDLVILGFDSVSEGAPSPILRVRQSTPVPVIALSGQGGEDAAVAALAEGADDFIQKPFSIREIVARVGNALRRRARERGEPTELVIGDLEVDFLYRRVRSGGQDIHLSTKAFEVLRVLAQKRGRAFTHQEIMRAVWGETRQNRIQSLRLAVGQLRRKIEPDHSHPIYILTETGVGYRLGMHQPTRRL